MRKVEKYHIGILAISHDVETMLVGSLYQRVVAINQLDIFSLGHLQTGIAGYAHATILLTYVDDVVSITNQFVHRTHL